MTISKVSLIKNIGNLADKTKPPQSAVVRLNKPVFELAKVLNRVKLQKELTQVVERNARVFQSDEELNEAGLTDTIKKRKFLMKS